METEVWKSLKGFQENGDFYEVSNLGNVRSVDKYVERNNRGGYFQKGRLLKQTINRTGYSTVSLKLKGKEKRCEVHRLVAKVFILNPDDKPNVNHIDSNTINNRTINLEWVTQSENIAHAIKKGNKNDSGENHTSSKLTNKDVIDIRSIYKNNSLTLKDIGLRYNMSESAIWKVINYKSYKNV